MTLNRETNPEANAATRPERVPLRRNRGYTCLLSASTISNLGDGASMIAYPWLASAITRNPVLIALVFVAQRLPWLVFTLPAGVITDRVDRRKAMIAMDTMRGVITAIVALAVLSQQGTLPGLKELDTVTGTRTGLYVMILLATLLMGMAEVLRDNSGQTLMPSLVEVDDLEKANGRLWSAEQVMNTFVGPPLGSLLLIIAFCLPFFVDAASFFAAAALVAMIPGRFRAERVDESVPRESWIHELKEGVRWLWGHDLLRPMAIILGLMNMASMCSGATMVLFSQEVLGISALTFSILFFGGAIGGIIGAQLAPRVSRKFGAGTCLAAVLASEGVSNGLIGLSSSWGLVMLFFALGALVGSLWNVITVSLRQSIIPSHLLGRVNSVYRFFAWGMMPLGALLGGLVVVVVDSFASREMALRMTFFVNALIHAGLFVFGKAKLTTAKIEAARAGATVRQP